MSQRRDNGKTGAGRSSGLTERLARTSALHPWRAIGLWAVLVVLAVFAVGSLLGSGLTSDIKFRADKPDSLVGQELLEQRLTGPRQITDFVVVRSATGTVDDPAFKAYVDEIGVQIASKAIGLFGGMGTGDDDFPISKYLRDTYTFLHGFSTTEVALLIGAPTVDKN